MNFILVFILPSVFGFKLMYDNLEKKDNLILFIYECMIILLSNLICTALVYFINNKDCNIVEYAESSMSFSIIYIMISIFIGCIIGFIITIVDKFFSIDVEVKYEKKEKISDKKLQKSIKNSK